MARCQHCKKLTHSEHLNVFVDMKDCEKIDELMSLALWIPNYQYLPKDPREIGKLRTQADIVLHFILVESKELPICHVK